MKIKMCGFKNIEDIKYAVELGVDFIGLVFHRESSRYIDLMDACNISLSLGKSVDKLVAVFTEHTIDEINDICSITGVKTIQLHGEGSKKLTSLLCEKYKIIYAVKVDNNGPNITECDSKNLGLLSEYKDYILYDNSVAGSGIEIDTKNLKHNFDIPFFIAGGVNINNVIDILNKVKPNGVDVSSGIEHTKGIKDQSLIKEFLERLETRD